MAGGAIGQKINAGNDFGGRLAVNTARGLANAATRSALDGTSFGDNLIAVLPDVIGGTIGDAVGARITGRASRITPSTLLDDTIPDRIDLPLDAPTLDLGLGRGGLAGEASSPSWWGNNGNLISGGNAAGIIQRAQRRIASVAEQVIGDMASSNPVEVGPAPRGFSYAGGPANGRVSTGNYTDSPYVYDPASPSIVYYELKAGDTQAVSRIDAARTAAMNERLRNLDLAVGGALAIGPLGGAAGIGLVAAAPIVWSASEGFVYANALRLSTAGQLTTELVTGVSTSTYLPAAAATAVAVDRLGVRVAGAGAGAAEEAVPVARTYRGGAYGRLSSEAGVIERHHAPPNSLRLTTEYSGPAIQMDYADHLLTSSHTRAGLDGKLYRAEIQSLIDSGNMRGAMAREIWDIRRAAVQGGGPANKYNAATREMLDYAYSKGWISK